MLRMAGHPSSMFVTNSPKGLSSTSPRLFNHERQSFPKPQAVKIVIVPAQIPMIIFLIMQTQKRHSLVTNSSHESVQSNKTLNTQLPKTPETSLLRYLKLHGAVARTKVAAKNEIATAKLDIIRYSTRRLSMLFLFRGIRGRYTHM